MYIPIWLIILSAILAYFYLLPWINKKIQINKSNKSIIYVLDRLLDVSVRGFTDRRNVDINLYKILNSPEVYQEILHMGYYPAIRENKEISKEFANFIDSLSMYLEYDTNTDYFWTKTAENPKAQDVIHQKMDSLRKQLLRYLFDKKLISNELYQEELNHKVKNLTD